MLTWENAPLGKIAEVKTGPFGSSLHASDYVVLGTPIITVEHLGERSITQQNLPLVSDADRQRLSSYTLQTGDIVFSRVGSVDRSAFVTEAENGWLFSGRLLRIRLSEADVDSKYLSYYFKYDTTTQRVRDIAVGQTMASLNTKLLNSFVVEYPPLPEQRAIAAALSDADSYIAALERLIDKKRNIKKGTMQELLTGKRRLPGFTGKWDLVEIGSLADPNINFSYVGGPFGSNLKASDYTENGIQIVQLQNIGDGVFLDDSQVFTSVKKADELMCSNIYAGDIILSKMGDPVARACIIPDNQKRMVMCSDGIRLAVNEEKYNKHFVLYSINDYQFRSEAESHGIGSTRKRISLNTLKKMKLLIPQKHEQDQIAFILASMDSEINALTAKLNKVRNIKQGMMQELLTGRIRFIQEDMDDAED